MWVMVLVLITNLSSSDMAHIDNISSTIAERFDTEEACHNQLYKKLDEFSTESEVYIKKNEANYLTLTLKGVNALVYTCVSTFEKS